MVSHLGRAAAKIAPAVAALEAPRRIAVAVPGEGIVPDGRLMVPTDREIDGAIAARIVEARRRETFVSDTLDIGQGLLDIASLVPIPLVSSLVTGANVLISVGRGNYGDAAARSLLFTLPMLGGMFRSTTLTQEQMAERLLKLAKEAAKSGGPGGKKAAAELYKAYDLTLKKGKAAGLAQLERRLAPPQNPTASGPPVARRKQVDLWEWLTGSNLEAGVTNIVDLPKNQQTWLSWYKATISNPNKKGSVNWLETQAHEGFHKWLAENLSPVTAIGKHWYGAPVVYIEELIAYTHGQVVVGRYHKLLLVPLQAWVSLEKASHKALMFVPMMSAYVVPAIDALRWLSEPRPVPKQPKKK